MVQWDIQLMIKRQRYDCVLNACHNLLCDLFHSIVCPPPWPEAKEKSFAEQMRFLGLRPGGWAWYFQHQFRFSMCYPKGAHSFTHLRGQLPTFWAFWIQFQIFNVLPQGGSFVGSPLAAITHFWGILDLESNFNVLLQGGSFVYSSLAAITHFWGILDSVQKF